MEKKSTIRKRHFRLRVSPAALLLAGGFALTGAVVSLTRIRLPLPEGLARHKR